MSLLIDNIEMSAPKIDTVKQNDIIDALKMAIVHACVKKMLHQYDYMNLEWGQHCFLVKSNVFSMRV